MVLSDIDIGMYMKKIIILLSVILMGCATKPYGWTKNLETRLHCGMTIEEMVQELGEDKEIINYGKRREQEIYNYFFWQGGQFLRMEIKEEGLVSSQLLLERPAPTYYFSEPIYYCQGKN